MNPCQICRGALVGCVLALQAFAAPASDAPRDVVARLDARRMQALCAADLPALERIFADDCTYVHASGRVQSKNEYLALVASGALRYLSMRYEEPPQVRFPRETVAIVSGRTRLEARGRDGPVNTRRIVTTAVYAQTAHGWELVSFQGTSAP